MYVWSDADGRELDNHTEKEFSKLEPWGFWGVSLESLCMARAALVCSGGSSRCVKIFLLEEETLVHVTNGIRVERNICFGKMLFCNLGL